MTKLKLSFLIMMTAVAFPIKVVESQLSDSLQKRRTRMLERGLAEEVLDVLVAFNDGGTSLNHHVQNGRSHIRTRFRRADAVAMSVTVSDLDELERDPAVTLVEEDSRMYPLSTGTEETETTPWGIVAVGGTSDSIPLPAEENCFKVCVVDSGLMLSHEDIPYSSEDMGSKVGVRGVGFGQPMGPRIIGKEFGLPPGQTWYDPAPASNHGTHVTGTIVAAGGNGIGVVGVIANNQGICLMEARVFGDDQAAGAETSSIDAGVEWCADNGARVINMSLGGIERSNISSAIYERLEEEGVLVIAASGNYGNSSMSYPASYGPVMSVGAVDANLTRANFSQFNSQVDISAPGQSIMSTVPGTVVFDQDENPYQGMTMAYSPVPEESLTGELVDCGLAFDVCAGVEGKICLIERGNITFLEKSVNCQLGGAIGAIIYNNEEGFFGGTLGVANVTEIPVLSMSQEEGEVLLKQATSVKMVFNFPTYAALSGTSMASPHVAGVATKIWAPRPECTNAQVRMAIEETALDLGAVVGRDDEFGHGMIQAVEAYNYLLDLPPPCGLARTPTRSSSNQDCGRRRCSQLRNGDP